MILIGIILIVVLFVLGILLMDWQHENVGGALVVISVIMFLVLVILWPISYGESVKENGWLLATQKNVKIARQVALRINEVATVKEDAPKGVTTSSPTMVGGSVTNMNQSSNASEAWRVYGDLVQAFNSTVGRRQTQLANWFMRPFVTPLPPGIKMIDDISFE